MFGIHMQRSYKYIMYATKVPSLRIDQSDLQCKNGCGFYGNVQWQGYCSKCHRELMHRQRKSEKADIGSPSTHREHQTLERQPKTGPIAGFSKFEEKKLRQTDSLKRNKLLKLNVFRKASNAKDVVQEKEVREKPPRNQFAIPAAEIESQKRDFDDKFSQLDSVIERDTRKYITYFFQTISKQYNMKTVDELSDMTQNFYQLYAKHMDESAHYQSIDAETKELLLDFVEKHVITYLHSILFTPFHSDDEKKDAQIRSRIRQLSWVSPQHLDCRVGQENAVVRDLLYSAITELITMDSVASPGEKLASVVGCCRGVVSAVSAASGGPASADELLPALIFTVLKANPPRLTSNINFITRFCNAARLMTGEGGYYFTNLCCAVSFIENLTPESLNMTKEDFDAFMDLPAAVSGGSWVAALSLCEGLHGLQDQLKELQELEKRMTNYEENLINFNDQVSVFKNEVKKKVHDVLYRTPLDFTRKHLRTDELIKSLPTPVKEATLSKFVEAPPPPPPALKNAKSEIRDVFGSFDEESSDSAPALPPKGIRERPAPERPPHERKTLLPPPGSLLDFSADGRTAPALRTVGVGDFLSPSPVFGLDSFDELATPDEFGGLSNVNYDIDLSDLSGENSTAEDPPFVPRTAPRDPFSPVRSEDGAYERVWTGPPPRIVDDGPASILDADESPTADGRLPSPMKPAEAFCYRANNK